MRAVTGARRQFLLGVVTIIIIIVGVALVVAALAPGSDGSGIGGIFSRSNNSNNQDGPRIVVNGYGQASAPADSASIQLLIQNQSGGYSSGRDYGTPAPGAEGSIQVPAAVPIVDALVSAGVPRDDIDVVASPTFASSACYSQGCPSPFRVDIKVDQPSLDRVTKLINLAAQSADDNELRITDVGASYTMSDCSTLERQARQSAIEDAQKEAAQQAQLLHVRLNTMVEVSDVPGASGSQTSTGCAGPANPSYASVTGSTLARSSGALTVPDFDPKTPTDAVTTVTVKLTYDILSGS